MTAMRCGCHPRKRIICNTHCQWQGCAHGRHTDACVAGVRVADLLRPEGDQGHEKPDQEPGAHQVPGDDRKAAPGASEGA